MQVPWTPQPLYRAIRVYPCIMLVWKPIILHSRAMLMFTATARNLLSGIVVGAD